MVIPTICLEWINLQRSGYKDTEREFIDDIKKEYKLMKPYLPKNANMILDIGCGVGGIDVMLYKHYDMPHLLLLDSKLVSRKPIYGFNRGVSFYNSFEATEALLKANDVYSYSLFDLTLEIEILNDIDLIISILSCGYHYSVNKYIKAIDSALAANGVLIMDIREGTEGIKEVEKFLPNIKVISNYNKSHRICARRN